MQMRSGVTPAHAQTSVHVNQHGLDTEARPPTAPWKSLGANSSTEGYLVYYYSDPGSHLPVRDVTRPFTNKADPNIETGTFGLFSHCMWTARKGVVEKKRPYLFFVTRRSNGERVLAGYYKVGWYADNLPAADLTKAKRAGRDFALAAQRMHFVENPIAMSDLARRFRDKWYAVSTRGPRPVSADLAAQMKSALDRRPNVTSELAKEVTRLERTNLRLTGFRYVDRRRKDGYCWADARGLLVAGPNSQHSTVTAVDVPHTNWRCLMCGWQTRSEALLRQCEGCKAVGKLVKK